MANFTGGGGLNVTRADLRDSAPDLEALVLVVWAGLLALLIPGQLQLLWMELHHRILVHFDVRNQRLQSGDEGGRANQTDMSRFLQACWTFLLVWLPLEGQLPSESQW